MKHGRTGICQLNQNHAADHFGISNTNAPKGVAGAVEPMVVIAMKLTGIPAYA
jgi:hypothetical protein